MDIQYNEFTRGLKEIPSERSMMAILLLANNSDSEKKAY